MCVLTTPKLNDVLGEAIYVFCRKLDKAAFGLAEDEHVTCVDVVECCVQSDGVRFQRFADEIVRLEMLELLQDIDLKEKKTHTKMNE